jgi:hypothetical protein
VEQFECIRRDHRDEGLSYRALAARYGCTGARCVRRWKRGPAAAEDSGEGGAGARGTVVPRSRYEVEDLEGSERVRAVELSSR